VDGVDFSGKRIAIGGGTGDVGVEVVCALLDAGAHVVAIVRLASRATALPTHERLTLIEGFPDSDESAAALTEKLKALGGIDGAVASLGPWFHGPSLTALPLADWDKMVNAALTSHFVFAKAIIPALKPGGHYVMINGAGALAPVPHSGAVSILAHAQMMMAQVLEAEHSNLKIQTLMLMSIIATRARTNPDPSWVTAREVGEKCALLLSSTGQSDSDRTILMRQKSL
jgi:NAD(P)-dependent dehydrogenase (short-subunit alcohol dehydrogenase family)